MKNSYNEYLKFFQSKESRKSFSLIGGNGCTMVSAPHSVEQTREGKVKYGEYHTGVLARMLYDDLKCPIIFKSFNDNDDANYDEQSAYKESLKKYVIRNNIKYLIDLHQLAPYREVNIDLGTGFGKNISPYPEIIDIAKKHFIGNNISNITIDNPFSAAYPHTISSYIFRECQICCLQIEINSRLISDKYTEFSFDQVLSSLKCIINELNKE